MSFDKLQKSNFIPRVINFEVGGYKFKAKQLSHMQNVTIGVMGQRGEDVMTLMVIESIFDQDNNKMSKEQFNGLASEIQNLFIEKASAANFTPEETKKKGKPKRV